MSEKTVNQVNFSYIDTQLKYIESVCIRIDGEDYNSKNCFEVEKYKKILLITLLEAIAQTFYQTENENQKHFTKLILEHSKNIIFKTISIPALYNSLKKRSKYIKSIKQLPLETQGEIEEKKSAFIANPLSWSVEEDLLISESEIEILGNYCTYAWALYDYRSQLVHAHRGDAGLDYDNIRYITARNSENVRLTISSTQLIKLIKEIVVNIKSPS